MHRRLPSRYSARLFFRSAPGGSPESGKSEKAGAFPGEDGAGPLGFRKKGKNVFDIPAPPADVKSELALSADMTAQAVRMLMRKGDQAADKAEQYYKAAGIHLKALQANKPVGVTWKEYVERHCHIGIRRAQELIAIADGRTTLEKVRATKAESKRRVRQDAPRCAPPNPEDEAERAEYRTQLQADWLAKHPGKTPEDFAAAGAPPPVNLNAPEREPSGLRVMAVGLKITMLTHEIERMLKDNRENIERIVDHLTPDETRSFLEQYRTIITIAQDTAARLGGDRFTVTSG
jgi:hypothetical protein